MMREVFSEDGNVGTWRHGTVAELEGLPDRSVGNRHVELNGRELLGGHAVIA